MRKFRSLLAGLFGFIVILCGVAGQARAQGETFYKGKTVTIMVGSTAGGFYDRWARLFAQHLGK